MGRGSQMRSQFSNSAKLEIMNHNQKLYVVFIATLTIGTLIATQAL